MSESVVNHDQVEAAIDAVFKHGDIIDRSPGLRHSPVRIPTLAATTAVGMVGGYFCLDNDPQNYLSAALYTPIILAGGALTKAGHDRYRGWRQDKVHETINEAINEPVDLFRVSYTDDETGEGGEGLMLRHYGFDVAKQTDEPTVGNTIERSRELIAFAREHGISFIVTSEQPFADQLEGNDRPGLARTDGRLAIGSVKDKRYSFVVDDESAQVLISCNIDAFEELVNEQAAAERVDLTEAVVKALGDPILAGHYGRYASTGNAAAKQQLSRAIKQAIERYADSGAEIVATKTSEGFIERHKMHSLSSVTSRGRVAQFSAGIDSSTGEQLMRIAGIHELATLVGQPDNQSLLTLLSSQELAGRSKTELLIGLQLLIDSVGEQFALAQQRSASDMPIFEAIEPLITRLRSKDITAYSGPRRGVERLVISWSTKLAAFAGGVILGMGATAATNAAYDYRESSFSEYAEAHHLKPTNEYSDEVEVETYNTDTGEFTYTEDYKKFLETDASLADRLAYFITERSSDIYTVDNKISTAVADFLINQLDMQGLSSDLPYYELGKRAEWKHKLRMDVDPNIYAQNSNSTGFGDVSTESNLPVYTIDSLNGAPTDGYWYTNTYDSIEVDDGSSVFKGGSLHMSDSGVHINTIEMELPATVEGVLATDPDFMVETPYIGIGERDFGPVNLPVQAGMTIVGARIVDKADESKYVLPTVISTEQGTYHINVEEDPIISMRMEEPVLRYWAKYSSSKDTPIPQAFRPIDVSSVYRSNVDSPMRDYNQLNRALPEISEELRQELGLDAKATPKEILGAIKGKLYAYEPFEYGNVDKDLTGASSVDVVRAVSQTLAELETLNCNVATMTYLLATYGEGNYAGAAGFGEDGDGILSQQESHAWVVDSEGAVIDPTPVEFAPGVEPRTGLDKPDDEDGSKAKAFIPSLKQTERGTAALLTAALLVVAYRRRQPVVKAVRKARVQGLLSNTAIQQTLETMYGELYGNPTKTIVVPTAAPQSADEVAERYVRNYPAEATPMSSDGSLPERLRKRLIRMHDGTIRRYVELSAED